ncbi:Tat (twin-arginine translocation) pathway signal sequence [Rhodospirillales bacterium URHD0017]|nr:Tat (twin-arginine translocation) pathway signal sequence [Rhodospirillales bacterium URHD0017]
MRIVAQIPLSRRHFMAGLAVAGVGGSVASSEASQSSSVAHISDAIQLSIDNIVREGTSDVFHQPSEVALLARDQSFRSLVAARTLERIAQGHFDPRHHTAVELVDVPKKGYGARRACAAMCPLDTIEYLSLAVQVAPLIERCRVPAPMRQVFSYRFSPRAGRLFDARYSYTEFTRAVRKARDSGKVVVRCDIERFYPSISPATALSALERCGVDAVVSQYLFQLLTFWSSCGCHGLPVGSNASRILAEAVLVPTDNALLGAGIDFVRFVDDYCLIADDAHSADVAVQSLAEFLKAENLRLNESKTVWLTRTKAEPFGNERGRNSTEKQQRIGRVIGDPPPAAKMSGSLGVPRKFRAAIPREIAQMRRKPPIDFQSLLGGAELSAPWLVRQALRIALYGTEPARLRGIPALLSRYPEMSEYCVGMLTQCADRIPANIRHDVGTGLSALILNSATPTFAVLNLVELFGNSSYPGRKALLQFCRMNAYGRGPHSLRFALRSLARTGGIPADIRVTDHGEWTARTILIEAGKLAELQGMFKSRKVDGPRLRPAPGLT